MYFAIFSPPHQGVLPESVLFENAAHGLGSEIFPGMWNGDSAGFGRVLVLVMTSDYGDQSPPVLFDATDQLS